MPTIKGLYLFLLVLDVVTVDDGRREFDKRHEDEERAGHVPDVEGHNVRDDHLIVDLRLLRHQGQQWQHHDERLQLVDCD